jgi:alginate O-acetyltransferase complex protein AlgI
MLQSPIFWLLLAISAVVHWLLPVRLRAAFLAICSLGYLLWLQPVESAQMMALVLTIYLVAPQAAQKHRQARAILSGLIIGVLAWLAWFKYLPPLLATLGIEAATPFAVPLGVSYLSFKLIHYVVERARGVLKAHTLADFTCYMFLFPVFTAGPIQRMDQFLATRAAQWEGQFAIEGLTRIAHGLIKKFVIAGLWLAPLYERWVGVDGTRDLLANLATLSPLKIWLFLILTYLYAYLDFSAYSDIAIGAARLFGIRVPENFNWPIVARNIGEFWKRWHMTLAAWCQAYVYMPALGLTRKPYLAVAASFTAMGLWHAGALHWLFWGLYQALGVSAVLALARRRRARGVKPVTHGIRAWLGWPVTFLFVTAGFAFTTVHGIADVTASFRILGRLVGL